MGTRRSNGFFSGYFERISWKVLDRHRPIIKEMIRGHAGVYALYKGVRLYYVGLANNLMNRVNHHLKDRHKGKWDRFSVYLTPDNAHMRPLEALMLRVINPRGNKVRGRLRGAQDMVRALKRKMDEHQRDETASLLGGRFVMHRRRSKARGTVGTLVLARLVERPVPLKAWYKDRVFRATLRRDGHIHFRRTLFDSPSGAAKAAAGRGMRGWLFWHFRSPRGEWVRLVNLKR
jgi:hypothetical protein